MLAKAHEVLWFFAALLIGIEPVIAMGALLWLGVPAWLAGTVMMANVMLVVLALRYFVYKMRRVEEEKAAKRRALEREERHVRNQSA